MGVTQLRDSQMAGEVQGPSSSTDNAVARWDSTSGKLLQNSTVTIDDSGSVDIPSGQTYKVNGTTIGSINSGGSNKLAYYASSGTVISADSDTSLSAGDLTLGIASVSPGSLSLAGNTSGKTKLIATAVAGATTLTLPAATDTLVGKATTDTLTNKTLTSPVINSPTGIVKADVGLGNVDNTSNATERAAVATLTNKDLSSSTNTFPSGTGVQQVSTITGTMATGTTVIPVDNTTPQSTEGDQYMSLAITPKSTTNVLEVEVTAHISSSIANNLVGALFQDSGASALATSWTRCASAGGPEIIHFVYRMTAGTTSATTFKFRAGGQSAGTTTFNGVSGTSFFNGTLASSMVIREYKA